MATVGSYAQCDQQYKPFKEFNNDTIAYLYNDFEKRSECYRGKSIKNVMQDLELPILNYGWRAHGDTLAIISLHVLNINEGSANPLKDYYIFITVEPSLSMDKVTELNKIYPNENWTQEHCQLFQNLQVNSILFNPYMKDLMIKRQTWKYD